MHCTRSSSVIICPRYQHLSGKMKVLLADKLAPIVAEYLIENGHEVHSDPSLKEDPLVIRP